MRLTNGTLAVLNIQPASHTQSKADDTLPPAFRLNAVQSLPLHQDLEANFISDVGAKKAEYSRQLNSGRLLGIDNTAEELDVEEVVDSVRATAR